MKHIKLLLTRSNAQISEDRADRITRAVENAAKAELMNIQTKIDRIEDKKERMLDMSSDNRTTTKNAIDDLDATGFVQKYNEYEQELFILDRERQIAQKAFDKLLAEEETEASNEV